MFKLKEVCLMLNCSLSNVYALVQQGKLAVVATGAGGKGFRVSDSEIARFKESQMQGQEARWPRKVKKRPSGNGKASDWF